MMNKKRNISKGYSVSKGTVDSEDPSNMALRDYLYAKHVQDAYTVSRINKVDTGETAILERKVRHKVPTRFKHHHVKIKTHAIGVRIDRRGEQAIEDSKAGRAGENSLEHLATPIENINTCSGKRAQITSDGSKVCQKCSDCPKKRPENETGIQAARINVEVGREEKEVEVPEKGLENLQLHIEGLSEQMEIDFTDTF